MTRMTYKGNPINIIYGDWLYLLRIILWWFIRVVCIDSLFCFTAVRWSISACLTIYPSKDIWLVSSLGVTGKDFCMNRVFLPLGLLSKDALAGLSPKCRLHFVRNFQTVFQWPYHWKMCERSSSSVPLPVFDVITVLFLLVVIGR